MSIIEKVFKCEETELSVIEHKDSIWLRGKTIVEILVYSNPLKAIRKHVDSEDKREISEFEPKSSTPLRMNSEIPFTLTNPVYIA